MEGRGVKTGIQKDIWLHICREGGTWTAREIADQFNEDRQSINVAMHNMATVYNYLKRTQSDGRTSFGITASCAVPRGVTINELAAAGVVMGAEVA